METQTMVALPKEVQELQAKKEAEKLAKLGDKAQLKAWVLNC